MASETALLTVESIPMIHMLGQTWYWEECMHRSMRWIGHQAWYKPGIYMWMHIYDVHVWTTIVFNPMDWWMDSVLSWSVDVMRNGNPKFNCHDTTYEVIRILWMSTYSNYCCHLTQCSPLSPIDHLIYDYWSSCCFPWIWIISIMSYMMIELWNTNDSS